MVWLVPQDWDESLFEELRTAGGMIYSNYAVGYNNVDVKSATKHGIPVGNTPGARWPRLPRCRKPLGPFWLSNLSQVRIFNCECRPHLLLSAAFWPDFCTRGTLLAFGPR